VDPAFDALEDASGSDSPELHGEGASGETSDESEDPGALAKRRGTFLLVALAAFVVLGAAGATGFIHMLPTLRASMVTTTRSSSAQTTGSVEPTMTAADKDQIAAESVVTALYSALNASDTAAARSLLTSDTQNAVDVGVFRDWSYTTIQVARSVIETDTASVYGQESQRQLGSAQRDVKFSLLRTGDRWLVTNWQAVDAGALSGAVPSATVVAAPIALDEANSKDVVSTLLQARQAGDAETIRTLTTARFQSAYGATWLNEVNNSVEFSSFTITGVRKKGDTYVVSALESWAEQIQKSTYGVVMQNQTILVDTWSAK